MTDRVAIVGAREHPNLEMVREYVRSLPRGTAVISGGARGVDQTAIFAAESRHGELTWENIHPRWVESRWPYALHARPRDHLLARNTMLAVACTRMVVFPDGSKGGCWDAARQAKRFRRPCEVRWVDGRVEKYS